MKISRFATAVLDDIEWVCPSLCHPVQNQLIELDIKNPEEVGVCP